MITEKSLKADINIATAASHTIIVALSGTSEYIVIDHINLNAAGTQTVQLKDGSTSYGGVYALSTDQSNLVLDNSYQNEDGVITLSSGSALVITLTQAVQVSGFVRYRIKNR